jgi:hypothetical protein
MKTRTLVAKNPSEERGIRKALRAAGLKFEFKRIRRRGKKKTRKKSAARKRRGRNARRRRR